MEKQIITVCVPENLVQEMRALNYELTARENILTFLILRDESIQGNKNFEAYQAEYVEKNAEYLKLKKQVETEYVIPQLEGRKAVWELDFETHELTIEVA